MRACMIVILMDFEFAKGRRMVSVMKEANK